MASFMLFVCSFNFFSTYGGFIFFVIFWSLVWAMCFFPAIMMTVGSCGDRGNIKRAIYYLQKSPTHSSAALRWAPAAIAATLISSESCRAIMSARAPAPRRPGLHPGNMICNCYVTDM